MVHKNENMLLFSGAFSYLKTKCFLLYTFVMVNFWRRQMISRSCSWREVPHELLIRGLRKLTLVIPPFCVPPLFYRGLHITATQGCIHNPRIWALVNVAWGTRYSLFVLVTIRRLWLFTVNPAIKPANTISKSMKYCVDGEGGNPPTLPCFRRYLCK